MKVELPYFFIGNSLGGQQEWLPEYMMRIGGCAAVTACDCSIYFELYKGVKNLYPFDKQKILKADYIKFTDLILKYQIDNGFPVPCLTLNHKNPLLDDYVWHWFLLTGYEIVNGNWFVKAVSYGYGRWLNFDLLWDTGFDKKGGLIIFRFQ